MAVPGVDMCNHSYQPNAAVRLVHSPAACQGLDALEEVAPVVAAAACPSYFQLVAGALCHAVPPISDMCFLAHVWKGPMMLIHEKVWQELTGGYGSERMRYIAA
jgi:hypothetical protein